MPGSNTIVNPLLDDISESELQDYVVQKSVELETDYSMRIGGTQNRTATGFQYAGYNNLRDFYNGNHWSYVKDDGTPMRVYNYCRATVINYQAFLANEPPDIDVPPRDENDDLELARVEQVEKLLSAILEDNKFPLIFSGGVFNQSLLGDAFIFGPYIEWIPVEDKAERRPRIRFTNIKRMENVRIIWSDENYEEFDGFIIEYRISKDRAESIFQKQMEDRGMDRLPMGNVSRNIMRGDTTKDQEMVSVRYYWGPRYMLAMVGNTVIDFVKHDWGFVPGVYIRNLDHPTLPWGVSDIEDILDAQTEYNEAASATRGKINQVAVPHVFYSGEGEPIQYDAGQAQMIKLGPDDKVFPDPVGQSTAPFEAYSNARRNDITALSQISDIFFGSTQVARATGRALSVLLTGVNNRVKQKQVRWNEALKELFGNTLRLIEVYEPAAVALIQNWYKVDIFFPSVLIRNVTEEINKFNMKLQSLETTMKNIGIPSPRDEIKKMVNEWENTPLMLEISRNPQLRLQVQEMIRSQQEQQLAGGGGPMLQEDENDPGEQPASAEGVPIQSPSSAEGAVAQEAFRES